MTDGTCRVLCRSAARGVAALALAACGKDAAAPVVTPVPSTVTVAVSGT